MEDEPPKVEYNLSLILEVHNYLLMNIDIDIASSYILDLTLFPYVP